MELVALEIADLEEHGVRSLSLTGFDGNEIEQFRLAGQDGWTDEDAIAEPPAMAVTRAGDLWLLAGHRLLCGDATVSADVAHLLGDVGPSLMVTDPPYGVAYNPAWRQQSWRGARSTGTVPADDRMIPASLVAVPRQALRQPSVLLFGNGSQDGDNGIAKHARRIVFRSVMSFAIGIPVRNAVCEEVEW
jgi:hypothetical protein